MALKFLPLTATKGLDERQQPTTDGAEGFALESENVAFGQSGALVMRLGMKTQALTSSGITGIVEWLGKFVTNAGVEELWACSNNAGTANLARRVNGVWSTVTFSDTVNVSNLRYMQGVSLNGKFFLAYDSNVNRLHVWDGTALRRAGILKPSAPTVADTGSGSYGANARRYRVMFSIISGSDVVAQSELSDATNSFTPSGSGTAARVTKPTTPDSATHWAVYAISGATDTYALYKNISGNIAVGTTTYDDSVTPASYTGDNPAAIGEYLPPPGCKFLATDGAHLFMAGSWESSASTGETEIKQNRVWFTPALGASDLGDEERVPHSDDRWNKIDCGDAGPITAITAPLDGRPYALKADSTGVLAPTGDTEAPYKYLLLTPAAGAIHQRSVVFSENGEGVPCIYFAARTAVYQIVNGAIREVSEAIRRDLRLSNFSAANSFLAWDPIEKTLVAQTSTAVIGMAGQYVQFGYDVASDRWTGLSFGAVGGGWILGRSLLGQDTVLFNSGEVRCAVTAQDSSGVPRFQVGGVSTSSAGVIYAYGAQGGIDGSTPFTTRVRFRLPVALAQGRSVTLLAPTVIYRNPIGSAVSVGTMGISYISDDGREASTTVTLTATSADDPLGQQRVTVEGLQLADTLVVDVRLSLYYSASFTATVPPAIDAVIVPWSMDAEVAA
jgi:hypothetical protein